MTELELVTLENGKVCIVLGEEVIDGIKYVYLVNAGNKKVPFEARMDMRDVGAIYYIRDHKLITAKLNPLVHGNAEYAGSVRSGSGLCNAGRSGGCPDPGVF